MALYKPPIKGTTTQMPWLAVVSRSDPEFERRKYREVFYEFQNRVFLENPYLQGAYSRLSNVYPVGAPYGQLDPLVEAALAPTVGNAVPGLYEAVSDGKGWA